MEEKDIELKEISDLAYPNNTKKEQVMKRQNLTSLPDLLEIKLAQNGDQNSSRSNERFTTQPLSLFNIKNQTLKQLSQEVLSNRVHSFLLEVINDHDQSILLFQNFKKFEQDVKITVKHSVKKIDDSNKILDLPSLKDLPAKQAKKEGKERKKVRFADFIQEDHQHISIKIVKSNIKLSKESTSIREMAISLGKLFSFRQMSSTGEQKAKSSGSQLHNVIVEDQEDKPDLDMDLSQSVSLGKIQCTYRNPSIIMFEDEEQEEKQSEIFSSNASIISLQNILKSTIPLSQDIVKRIFWNCSPFLINLSLCLMVKCLTKYTMELKIENASWLLSTATIVAYKIFYDEEIEGLTSHFAKMLQMKNEDLVTLQIWFLQQLNYQIYVTNRQYFEIMSRLLKLKVRG